MKQIDRQWMTVPETAMYLGLTKKAIYGLVQRRELPHSKMGKRLMFNKVEIDKMLEKGRRND